MPNPSKGVLLKTRDGYAARITLKSKHRET